MLLHHEKNYTVVKSDETFIQQHDASSWQVNGKRFVTVKEVVDFSKGFSDTLSNWLKALDDAERRSFVDTLFRILEANKAKTAFLSNMSHEILTPMNAIIGLNDIALNDPSASEKVKEYLKKKKGAFRINETRRFLSLQR